MSTRDAAVQAAEAGWAVFPCLPGDKRPAIDRWEQRASADPEHVAQAWAGRYRDHNVGIACGPSGLVVLDLDTHGTLPLGWRDEPGVVDGKDVLAVLADRAGQGWPATHWVATPSGGWHLYFAMPDGIQLHNTASKTGPMVDTRGHGGYVVGAGSLTPAGRYETLEPVPPAPLPPWLRVLLDPPPPRQAAPVIRPATRGGLRSPRYAERALEDELDKLLSAREGERNVTLNTAALALATLCATGELDTTETAMLLTDAAYAIGLPPGEARATIASGMRAGLVQPRSLL